MYNSIVVVCFVFFLKGETNVMQKQKVAIYCRLSEEDRDKINSSDDSVSIQNQKSMLIQYCLDKQWDVYDIYSDDDYTGADRNRPAFKRLIEDAKARKFNIVLCKTQSRFTRELELVEKYIHGLFPLWGIRFISIVDNADTDNKGNKKSRQINGLVNEWYLEDMSDSIKSVLVDRRKKGYYIGAVALYGYKKDPDKKGHLVIDEEAAAVVREVFTLFAQGMGKMNIARMLNERGVPNPTEYKRLHGIAYKNPHSERGTLWHYFSVSDMLVNEMYIGNMVQGKYGSISYKTKQNKPRPKDQWYRVENTHEAIIDKALWDKVQALIKQRAKPFSNGNIGIFARKARCAYCGYTLRSSKMSDGRRYLRCSTRMVSRDQCQGSCINVKRLEGYVIQAINDLSQEYLDKDELERKVEFEDDIAAQRKALEKEMQSYRKSYDEYSKCIQSLYLDKVKGLITDSDFVELSREFSDNRSKVEQLISHTEDRISNLQKRADEGKSKKEIILQYTNLDHLTRDVVDTLIDYISVGKRIPGTLDVPIEIHWNF